MPLFVHLSVLNIKFVNGELLVSCKLWAQVLPNAMFRPSELSVEIGVLVETFNIRWNVHRDVAKKLLRSPPEVQWQVISVKVPRYVYNPNGFVISCIIKANNRFRDRSASHGCSAGLTVLCPEEPSSNTAHENRDSPCTRHLSQVSMHKSKTSDVVAVSESFLPMP